MQMTYRNGTLLYMLRICQALKYLVTINEALRAFNSVRSEELMSGELLGTIFRSIILWTLPPIALRGIR
jgi:hypothetical protein